MLVNIISLLVTYFAGKTAHARHGDANGGGFLANFTLSAMKKVLTVFALYSALIVVFIFGAVIITSDLIISTNKLGTLALSDLSWVGLGVVAFSLIGIAILSWMDFQGESLVWKKAKAKKPEQQPIHAITDAITLLILDYVDERKNKREAAARNYGAPHADDYSAFGANHHN